MVDRRTGVVPRSLHRKHGAGGEAPLRVVGADLEADLAFEGVGRSDDGDGKKHGANLPRVKSLPHRAAPLLRMPSPTLGTGGAAIRVVAGRENARPRGGPGAVG